MCTRLKEKGEESKAKGARTIGQKRAKKPCAKKAAEEEEERDAEIWGCARKSSLLYFF